MFAAQCQGCENPACTRDCPWGVDIPGILRRMEAENWLGAKRELRRYSSSEQICCLGCPAEENCQRHCYRRSFTGSPVRLADLLLWVDQNAD